MERYNTVYKGDPNPITIGQLRVVDFMNPSGLQALGGNLLSPLQNQVCRMIMDAMDGLRMQQGFLESSNVDVAEELVNMIVAQRAFEMTSKAVESSDQMMQTVNALKR